MQRPRCFLESLVLVFPFFPIAGFVAKNQVFLLVAGGAIQKGWLDRRITTCMDNFIDSLPGLYTRVFGRRPPSRGDTAFRNLGTCFPHDDCSEPISFFPSGLALGFALQCSQSSCSLSSGNW